MEKHLNNNNIIKHLHMVICYTVVVTKINHLCYTLMYHVFVPLSQKSISIRKYFIDSEKKT